MADVTTAENGAGAAEPAPEAKKPEDETTINFGHSFFAKLHMAYFRHAENSEEPVLMVEYGEQEVALTFPGIKRELNLSDDDHDARMLILIAKGLKFVNTLAIGDALPSEIITGKASWALTPQHAQIAYQRLALKLMALMTGGAVETSTAVHGGEEILKQAHDPEVRKKIAHAFDEAAVALGLGRERREEVVGFLETLAQELGYIEALRERFNRIIKVGRRLKEYSELGRKSGGGQRVADVIDQAARLIRPAVDQFVQLFKETDALTNDIMAVLRDLEGHLTAIREKRDEIHQRLNPWNDLLDAWEKIKDTEITGSVVEVAARTVRMLAPRFMPAKEWVLRFKQEQSKKATVKSWRSPDQQRDELNKTPGKVMRW
jgi:plasmid stabilization system protein ParE